MKTLAFAGALALALAGCSTDKMTAFNAGLITTTQNVVALNNALVQVNATLIDNAIAQAKLLAPYQCGAYALAAAILKTPPLPPRSTPTSSRMSPPACRTWR